MFITFEGPEGCGKSTQLALLASALREEGREVVTTREPGGVPAAERIRELVLHGSVGPETEALLFLAARAEHARAVLRPALERGAVVLCDRFSDSTLAYQGYGLGLDVERLRAFCDFAATGLAPDVTLLLDLRPEEGLQRRQRAFTAAALTLPLELDAPAGEPPARKSPAGAEQSVNRMENRTLDFHRRVREGFLREAERDPERIRIVDASRTVKQVHGEVLRIVRQHLMAVPEAGGVR